METAVRENPTHGATVPRNRAPGAVRTDKSRSIKRAAKQEKVQPKEMCFFLTSTFIELTRHWHAVMIQRSNSYASVKSKTDAFSSLSPSLSSGDADGSGCT